MYYRLNSTRSILLVFGLLTSGSGCQVLNIPSYRVDAPGRLRGADVAGYSQVGCEFDDPMHTPNSVGCLVDQDCPPGFFPPLGGWMDCGLPVPAWYADWRAKKDLPEPAPYPRFHPLPTRPMFQPRPVSDISQWGASMAAPIPYGQLPTAEAGSLPWSRFQSPPSVEVQQPQPGELPVPNLAPPLAPEPLPLPAEVSPRRLPR